MKGFTIGDTAPQGYARCCLSDDGVETCNDPATVHVLISGHVATAFCAPHWKSTGRRMPHVDSHRFGDYCNLPDSHWIRTKLWMPGTCLIPYDLTQDLEQFANQPESAHA